MTAANGFPISAFPGNWGSAGTATFVSFTNALDASTDKAAFIFQAEEIIDISRVGIRLATLTGTSPTYKIGLQGVGADGHPNATYLNDGGGEASTTFTAAGWTNGTFHWINLANAYQCTRGQSIALVIEYSSGTINASNLITLTATGLWGDANHVFPSARTSTGTWADQSAGGRMIFGYGSTTRAYGNPILNGTSLAYSSSSDPDEYALRFIIPTWFCSTYKIRGFKLHTTFVAAQDLIFDLKEASSSAYGSALQTVTIDGDWAGPSPSNDLCKVMFTDTTLATLTAGTPYRLAFRPTSTTNTNLYTLDLDSVNDWDAFPPFGDREWYMETSVGGASWIPVTARRPLMMLLLDDITQASGGTVAAQSTETMVIQPRLRGVGYR